MLNLGVRGREFYQICSNDDPRLTFDLFYSRVTFTSLCICKTNAYVFVKQMYSIKD